MRPRHRSREALVADLERTGTARGRRQLGRYAIEGSRLLERALRAECAIEAVLVADGFGAKPGGREARLIDELTARGIELLRAPDTELERRTEGRGEGALLALLPIPEPEASLAEILRRDAATGASRSGTLLVLHEIRDPGNVGALLRTGLASGVVGAITVGDSDPYHPRAVRISRGSLFKLPLLQRPAAAPLLAELRELDVATLAAVVRGGVPLPSLALPARPVAVLVGTEACGLPDAVLDRVDLRVSIPMSDAVDSFSVSAAAAILLYELRRTHAGA